MFFLTPPTVAHAFVTEADSDGHVLTVRQQLVWQLIEADASLLPAGVQVQPACVALGNVPAAYKAEARRLERWLDALSDEFASPHPGREAALQSLTRLIMVSLLRL
ncbi:4-hydroxyphenylacetate catabolism regulatory protein HpaA, partial [Pseudomonas sp. SIMBA_064]